MKLAEAVVEIVARDSLGSAFARAKGETTGFVSETAGGLSGLRDSIGMVGGAFAAIGGAAVVGGLTAGIIKSVGAASNLVETTNKIEAIFGPAAEQVVSESDRMAESFGVVKNEYLGAASSFGSMFKGAGFDINEAARLGNQLTQLGMDLASFGNVSNQEAFTALQAAFRGEFDPAERLNIFLSAAKVQDEALRLGLAKTKSEVSDYAKRMATLSLVMQQTKDAQGDLAKTIDSPANAIRKLGGLWENLSAELGAAFLPAVKEVVPVLADLSRELGTFARGHAEEIKELASAIGGDLVKSLRDAREYLDHFNRTWSEAPGQINKALGAGAKTSTIMEDIEGVQRGVMEIQAGEYKKGLRSILFAETAPDTGPTEAQKRHNAQYGAARAPQPVRIFGGTPEAALTAQERRRSISAGLEAERLEPARRLLADLGHDLGLIGQSKAGDRIREGVGDLIAGRGLTGAVAGMGSDLAEKANAPAVVQQMLRAAAAGGQFGPLGALLGGGEAARAYAMAGRKEFAPSEYASAESFGKEAATAAMSGKEGEDAAERTATAAEKTATTSEEHTSILRTIADRVGVPRFK